MQLQNKNNTRLYLALSFFVPFIGICILMMVRGFIPFGDTSMLYSDMYHQYYPFFLSFRKTLQSGESLLYSWNVGMGMDYLGLISYYLASPLNLLSVLIPDSWTLGYFSMLMPIKLSLASLFFAIFLQRTFKKNDISIPIFGTFYGLCAWALGYQWNIMWLDTFALLPLVALGTVSLLRDRKFTLYTLTLFLSVFINYYVGLFTCIFVALIFLCYEISRWGGLKKFLTDLGLMAVFSALAIGMTALLSLPTLAALQTTQSSVNKFPQGFKLNIATENTWKGLWDAMRQVAGNMNGGIAPTFKEGLPNLYCGVLTNLLAILFLTCKKIRVRDKICAVLMLVFFNLSFIIRQLDYIWHGFHFTNMIPYRFSFLYSFVMLYMAYHAFLLRKEFKLWQILVSAALAVGLMFLPENKDSSYWIYNGSLLAMYTAALLLPLQFKRPKGDYLQIKRVCNSRRMRRTVSALAVAGIAVVEMVLNLLNFGMAFTGTVVTDYPRGTKYTESMIRYMKEREADTLFYRAETTHSQTLNDGALNDYYGVSTFTSSANVRVTEFMKALGYGAKNTYNRYCFEESSPVANLFLNLKYMLERQDRVEENSYFDDLHYYGKVHLLKNNAYLPLGFMAESQLINVDFKNAPGNALLFQNQLLKAASGIQEDAWTMMTDGMLSIESTDVKLNTTTRTGYSSYTTEANKGGTVVYKYTPTLEGFVCIDLELSKRNSFSVWKNGALLYSETYSIPQSLAVCNVVQGDIIEIKLTCKQNERGTINIHAGVLDETVFRKAYDVLAESTLDLTEFSRTEIKGTINCNRDGVLYTSIPQDGNWHATVDGQEAQIVLIGDAMVGLLLTEGVHTVTFQYKNESFKLGLIISLGCFLVFALIIYKWGKPLQRKEQAFSKSKRVTLRPWVEDDYKSLYIYARDPDVGPAAGWPAHKSPQESLLVIRDVLSAPETYAICLNKDHPVGSIGLKLKGCTDMTDRDDECELGYWIGKPFWGQGLVPEAAEEVLRHAFEDLGMQAVWCGYYDGNDKSKRVQEKLGFVYQYTTEDLEVPLLGEVRIGHTMLLTKKRWQETRNK